MLFIALHSGRRLCYVQPGIGLNKHRSESLTYMDVGGTKKLERLKTFSGKLSAILCSVSYTDWKQELPHTQKEVSL